METGANSERVYLLVPILLLFVLLTAAVIRGPNLASMAGFGSAIIVAAPLILATYALMAVALAGRGTVDLAVGPLLGFINVTVIKLNGFELFTSPLGVFFLAIGIGVLYQVLFALIIIYVRVQPIIVSLSGFLALSGINLVILPRPGGVAPEWMMSWGLGETIFSPVLLMVLLATGGWLLFTLTPFYSHLKLMGFDERAAYTSGVRINLVRIGAHCMSGVFIGLAAITFTSLISSGDPTQGTRYTLTAVTAMVLGGVSLAGGRGGVTGCLLGALNVFLIGYVLATFRFGGIQAFVTQLSYGVILVLSLLLTVLIPLAARYIRFISPFATFIVLSALFVGTMLHVKSKDAFTISPPEVVTAQTPIDQLEAEPGDTEQVPVEPSTVTPSSGAAKYMLLPLGSPGDGPSLQFTVLQTTVAVIVSGLVVMTLVFRFAVVEAQSFRFGPLLYGVISVLILMLFWLGAIRSDAAEQNAMQRISVEQA